MLEGLLSGHHSYLNGVHLKNKEEKRKIFNKFRRLYADNSLALEQIDIYDSKSLYGTHFEIYRDALKRRDKRVINQEEIWFKENYPLTSN